MEVQRFPPLPFSKFARSPLPLFFFFVPLREERSWLTQCTCWHWAQRGKYFRSWAVSSQGRSSLSGAPKRDLWEPSVSIDSVAFLGKTSRGSEKYRRKWLLHCYMLLPCVWVSTLLKWVVLALPNSKTRNTHAAVFFVWPHILTWVSIFYRAVCALSHKF